MKKLSLAAVFILAASIYAGQEIKLGTLFQDGAVFQQKAEIPVWGKTSPGKMLKADFAGNTVYTTSGTSGDFMFRLPPVNAGGPYTLVISSEDSPETVSVQDILVGEVWIASGQSNMEYKLGSDWAHPWGNRDNLARRQEKEFSSTLRNPGKTRFIIVPKFAGGTTETAFRGKWERLSPENAAQVSAAAAWFGKAIQEKLDVPVGLIITAWGGTIVEAWTSRSALRSHPETSYIAKNTDAALRKKDSWDAEKTMSYTKDPGNKGFALGYAKPDFDDSKWKTMNIPGSWIKQKISGNGSVWIRKKISLPADWNGKDLILETGGIDKHDTAYFNGAEIGKTGKELETSFWNSRRNYNIPGNLVKTGDNVIAIRAYSFIYDGAFIGNEADYQLKRKDDGKGINISGVWKVKPELDLGIVQARTLRNLGKGNPNTPGILFDGMINPLIPYAFRGVIWYQGESNAYTADDAVSYFNKLKIMIQDWRIRWGQGDFPFIQVQLAGYNPKKRPSYDADEPWNYLRESQRLVCESIPETYMATAVDVGEKADIHPQNKKTVGERLAFSALHHVYNFSEIVPFGPLFRKCIPEGSRIRVVFRNGNGLNIKGDFRKSFFLAGINGAFYPADELSIDGNSILLKSKAVQNPCFVRYAWARWPENTLYNGAGLPASPFRTDSITPTEH